MKVGISVTLDVECIRWLEKQPSKKSALVNEMVWNRIKEGVEAPRGVKTLWHCSVCRTVQRHPKRNFNHTCMNRDCKGYFGHKCQEWREEE